MNFIKYILNRDKANTFIDLIAFIVLAISSMIVIGFIVLTLVGLLIVIIVLLEEFFGVYIFFTLPFIALLHFYIKYKKEQKNEYNRKN